jgi:hypothetical protein
MPILVFVYFTQFLDKNVSASFPELQEVVYA